MKSKLIFVSLLAVVAVVISSCSKNSVQDILLTQNLSAKISVNETYTFPLPENVSANDFRITSPGLHGAVSAIQKDVAGSFTYIYTPQTNFTGVDHIVLSTINENEEDGDMDNDSHECDGNHDKDSDNDADNDSDNNDNEHHGGHHERGDHKKADKNMVINITLTVIPVSNIRR